MNDKGHKELQDSRKNLSGRIAEDEEELEEKPPFFSFLLWLDPGIIGTLKLILLLGCILVLVIVGLLAYNKGWITYFEARPYLIQARAEALKGDIERALQLISQAKETGYKSKRVALELISWIATNETKRLSLESKKIVADYISLIEGTTLSIDEQQLLMEALYKARFYKKLLSYANGTSLKDPSTQFLDLQAKTLFKLGLFASYLDFITQYKERLPESRELELYNKISLWAIGKEHNPPLDAIDTTDVVDKEDILRGLLQAAYIRGDQNLALQMIYALQEKGWATFVDASQYAYTLVMAGKEVEGLQFLLKWPGLPEDIEERVWQARVLISTGDYSTASLVLKKWIDAEPQLILYILLALNYTKSNATEESVIFAQELLRNATANPGLGVLAYIMQTTGETKAVEPSWPESMLDDIINPLSESPAWLMDFVELLEAKGFIRRVLVVLRRTMDISRNDPRFYPTLYRVAQMLGDEYYASIGARGAYQIQPWNVNYAIAYIQSLLMNRTEPLTAVSICESLLKSNLIFESEPVKILYMWALAQAGKIEEAEKVLISIKVPTDERLRIFYQCGQIEIATAKNDIAQLKLLLDQNILNSRLIFNPQRQFLTSLMKQVF